MKDHLRRAASLIWPVRKARLEGVHGEIDLVWENGRLVVNSANANQSWGSLQMVLERAFQEVDLKGRSVRTALVLGLGGGGAVKLVRSMHPECDITAVDDDPAMIRVAHDHFGVKADARTTIFERDAFLFLADEPGRHDLVVVDLFVDDRPPAALFRDEIVAALRRSLAPGGLLMVNTMGDAARTHALCRELERLGLRCRTCSPLPTNLVVIAS
jgi:SAM-dependent methyltransferase